MYVDDKTDKYLKLIDMLNDIGISLSAEKDTDALLIKIMSSALDLTNADGGTLYLLKNDKLTFEIVANKSLRIKPRKVLNGEFPISSISLYNAAGQPNLNNIVTFCVLKNKTVSIEDAYKEHNFDFEGTRAADKRLGYHSKSFIAIPLRNHEDKTIGVLQLINCMDENSGTIVSFSKEKIYLVESLASQAAILLTKQQLMQAQKDLFEALLQLIAKATDEKSIYTSHHCSLVPVISMMIANAANKVNTGPLKDFHLSQDQLEEIRIAAWLHDCGKITTPEHVMDKATKLSGIFDRIEIINHRFEILKRDIKIALLEKALQASGKSFPDLELEYNRSVDEINQAQVFLNTVNLGGEFLSDADKQRISALAGKRLQLNGAELPLLSDQEVKNLSIARGTLNEDERKIIQNHVKVTQKMLSSLPYPEYLKNVPEIAGNHHERVDGKGYPRGLAGEKMSMQARIIAIADIFEALTAADRPYKKANTLKETLNIMTQFKDSGHIDPDLFDIFMKEKIYLDYAKKYLKPEQIDL